MVRSGVSRQVQAAVAAAIALLVLADPAPASFKYLKTGMEAADFTLRALDDQEITLESLKQSPAALLVFWATWSPNAAPALREAQSLAAKHGGAGLRVIAVNLDRPEIGPRERELIEKTVRDLGLTVAIASDPGFTASSGMGVVASPSFALLDARGVLFWDGAGWSRTQQQALRERVEQLLGLREGTTAGAAAAGHRPAHKALLSFNLGRSFLRQGNPARAEGLFAAAADADPGWAAPRTLLGHLLLEQRGGRDVAQAEALFRAAAAIDPGDVSALTGLGEALLRSDRVNEAATVLERARQLDPAFTPAVAGRARALARQGRTAEALALYAEALELNPRDAAVFAGRAECRVTAGDLAEGTADYRRAVELLLQAR
jgi:tetratricopeptide (TPR) repeat protein